MLTCTIFHIFNLLFIISGLNLSSSLLDLHFPIWLPLKSHCCISWMFISHPQVYPYCGSRLDYLESSPSTQEREICSHWIVILESNPYTCQTHTISIHRKLEVRWQYLRDAGFVSQDGGASKAACVLFYLC